MTGAGTALVVGGDGLIGRALVRRLTRDGFEVLYTTRRPAAGAGHGLRLDLSADPAGWRPPRPVSVAFLCPAVSSLRACEDDPEGTARVNVAHLLALASSLSAAGAFPVFPSTNLVYDGSAAFRPPTDQVCPGTEYGRQKSDAERGVLGLGGAVVRMTKVLGPHDPLISGWSASLKGGVPVRPFRDKVMAPVSLPLAVEALARVAAGRVAGVSQVSAGRDVGYDQVAGWLGRALGADGGLVRPALSAEAGLPPSFSPAHTTLCTGRLAAEVGFSPPDPEETFRTAVRP